VEILGTLANLTTFDLPRTAKDPKPAWGNVLKRTGLLQVLMGCVCVWRERSLKEVSEEMDTACKLLFESLL